MEHKYRIVDGKHSMGKNDQGENTFAYKGDIIALDDAVAARFPGKFKRMVTADGVSVEADESAESITGDQNKDGSGNPNTSSNREPTDDDLQKALDALPDLIGDGTGQYNNPDYIVNSLRAFYKDLFTDENEEQVRAMFPKKEAAHVLGNPDTKDTVHTKETDAQDPATTGTGATNATDVSNAQNQTGQTSAATPTVRTAGTRRITVR